MGDDPTEPPSQVAGELIAELARLADDAAIRPDDRDLHMRLVWLVDLLIARGHLAPGHKKLIAKLRDPGARVRLNQVDDKRAVISPDIDCAANLHLCHGRCCSFTVSLAPEDLREGKLAWELEDPYVLRRNARTGYCEHLDGKGGCDVYEDRPAICRSYDCRQDRRVWLDYDARVPAPMPESVTPTYLPSK
jgi:Fe-S-cluster containining protein